MEEHRLVDGFGITKEWVQSTMSKEFNDEANVVSVDVLNVCGYMSAIARVHLSWKSSNGSSPSSVVAKIPSGLAAEEAWKKCGHMEEGEDHPKDPIHEHMHKMEIQVYSLFKEAPSSVLKIPHLYGYKPLSSQPVLLMEDIKDAFHIDLVDGFSDKQLYAIMDQQIALHKWSKKNEHLWKGKITFEMEFDPEGQTFCRSILKMMEQMVKEELNLEAAVQLLRMNFADNVHWIKDLTEQLLSNNKAVFIHGDLWAPQILWKGDEIAAIVDWALCRPGPRTEDILRVLTTCCSVETRRRMTKPLLEYYVKGMDGEITLDEIMEDYKNSLPASCTMMCFAVCMWSHSPILRHGKEDDEERVKIMRDRLKAAIEDTAALLGWN